VNEKHRLEGFQALVKADQTATHYFEETDGGLRKWAELSPEGKLEYISSAAAMYDVPFEQFAAIAREAIGDTADASLRLVLSSQRELHGLAELLPDDGRTESTPLVDRFKEIMREASDRESEAPGIESDYEMER
jgi:hypothetical protein